MKNKVLIIDDGVFMRSLIKRMLEANGFEIVGEAEDGVAGVARYEELKPDLVTLDITMPRQDGVTTLDKIIESDPDATVVMVSSLGQEENVKNAIRLGAKGFVVKPFTESTLISVLNVALGS